MAVWQTPQDCCDGYTKTKVFVDSMRRIAYSWCWFDRTNTFDSWKLKHAQPLFF